jgi:cell division protein FtsB
LNNSFLKTLFSYADTLTTSRVDSQVMTQATAEKVHRKIYALENEIIALKREKMVLVHEMDRFKGQDEKEAVKHITDNSYSYIYTLNI